MNQPSDDSAYRSAMSTAMVELSRINEEVIWLSNRMHQLNSVLDALKPVVRLGEQTAVEYRRPICESIESATEPVHANGLTPQGTAISEVMPQKIIESADPVQRRINSVLGLALA